jgi:hypothetical protein
MGHTSRRLILGAASVALAVATAPGIAGARTSVSANPAASCSPQPYAYAGLFSNLVGRGIKATLTTLASAQVTDGHVAGWIGVGGVNAGPGGQAEWLQAGVDTTAGGATEIYAETTQAGGSPTYLALVARVELGTPYRLAVVNVPNRPDIWQVWLNGSPVTAPVPLPGSSRFEPMAMSESWDGGSASCNGFAYRFGQLEIERGAAGWRALTDTSAVSDSGYRITDRTSRGFTASSS